MSEEQFIYWNDFAGIARQLHYIASRISKLIDGKVTLSEPEERLLKQLLDAQEALYPRLATLFEDEIDEQE